MPIETITDIPKWLDKNNQRTRVHLANYFSSYRGRYFEVFSNRAANDRFDPWNVLAVTALSVTPPAPAIDMLLTDPSGEFTRLLRKANTELNKAGTLRDRCSIALNSTAFGQLYTALKGLDGVGYVTTSKLMASRFPDVIPVRDSRVERLIGPDSSRWAPMHSALLEIEQRGPDIEAVDSPLGFDEEFRPAAMPSLLRRLDVALWMEAGRSPTAQ